MTSRGIYLALSRAGPNARAHFAIFIPNAQHDHQDVAETFRAQETRGTTIHVVGEPVIAGFALEFKRNYECSTSRTLSKLVPLGQVRSADLYDAPDDGEMERETTPRSQLEREAALIPPPRGGQNVRQDVDGITTKRCQEWTMEYLTQLVQKDYIDASAGDIAQAERDPPDFGVFGKKR